MGKNGHDSGTIKALLKSYFSQPLMLMSGVDSIQDDDSFLEKGVLDSTGVLELVGFIEKQFKMRVEADEIIPDNLDSFNKLVSYIEKKTA